MKAAHSSFFPVLLGIAAGLSSAGIHAQEIPAANQIEFRYDWLISESGPFGHLTAEGIIDPDAALRLEQVLQANAAGSDPRIETIAFSSDGGDLLAAMEIGRLLRRYQLLSSVEYDQRCLSACAYAFLGGVARNVRNSEGFPEAGRDDQAQLGFHGYTFDVQAPAQISGRAARDYTDHIAEESQITAGALADYLTALGISAEIIGLAAPFGRGEYLFPTISEMRRLRIVTDYDAPLGRFDLVVDGSALQATFVHQDHQTTFGCATLGNDEAYPVLVHAQRFYGAADAPIVAIQQPTKLSAMLAWTLLPWTERDLAHSHFHAHEWVNGPAWNPVFGYFRLSSAADDPDADVEDGAETGLRGITPANSAYLIDGQGTFAALTLLDERDLAVLFTDGASGFSFQEQDSIYASGLAHELPNTAEDQEKIRLVLGDCNAF